MAAKQFSEQLFSQNDIQARTTVLNYLDSIGQYAVENEEKYGPDLILYGGLSPSKYIEVEIKRVWTGSTLPWSTIQLPARKLKFTKLALPCEFWILNCTMEHAVIIDGFLLAKVQTVEVRNKYVASGEEFYQVPVAQCRYVQL